MATKILLKRGSSASLAGLTLSQGELAYTTDDNKLYIGDGAGGKIVIGIDHAAIENVIGELSGLGTAAGKNVGVAAGDIPVLDANGKLQEGIMPALSITDVFEAESLEAMLALNAEKGDIAVRSDIDKTFILKMAPASVASNWVEVRTPSGAVLSVNGKVGAVTLTAADVGLANADNTADADKPISTATQNALNLKAPINSPELTGAPTAPTADPSANNSQIATTAFVKAQNYIADGGVIDGGIF